MRVDIELELLLKHQKRSVNLDLVASLKTFKESLLLCKALSMLEDRYIADTLKMSLKDFVGIWAGDGYFPMEKLIDYMRICENIVPVLWLALKCGYNLKPLEQELEQESRLMQEELLKRQQELKTIKDEMFGGLLERLESLGSKEGNRIAKLIEELKRELAK